MNIIKKLYECANEVHNIANSYENGAREKFKDKRPCGIEAITYISESSKENIKALYLNSKITKFLITLINERRNNNDSKWYETPDDEVKQELEKQIISDEEKQEIMAKLLK